MITGLLNLRVFDHLTLSLLLKPMHLVQYRHEGGSMNGELPLYSLRLVSFF